MNAPRPLEVVVRRQERGFVVHRLDRGAALLQGRPRPRPATLTQTEAGAVLVSEDRTVYLRLGPEEEAIWELIDGHNTVAEIATAYFIRFGSLHVSRVTRFVQTLRNAGLVEVEPADFLRKRFAHVSWLRRELTWDGMHELAAWVHARLAPLATWWNLPIAVAILGLGAVSAWVDQRPDPSTGVAALAWFVLALVGNVAVHELAHAVAVVGFGRRVRGAALGWRGVYVDTTDMYLGSRRQHAAVAMAGPASNLVIVALAATVACALPGEFVGPFRALMSTGLLVAFLTGWPFGFDNDATNALSDLTGVPNLRRASWDALRSGVLRPVHLAYVAGTILTLLAPPLGLLLLA